MLKNTFEVEILNKLHLEEFCAFLAKQLLLFCESEVIDLNTKNFTFLLDGDLGAGKTTFVQAMLRGLGYYKKVSSPTFTIMKEYIFNEVIIHHFDLYRNEFDEPNYDLLDFFNYGINFVEWPTKGVLLLPQEYLLLEIGSSINEEQRILNFSCSGQKYQRFLNKFMDGLK